MKRTFLVMTAFILVIVPSHTIAKTIEYDLVATSGKNQISLYAKKMNDLYYDFKIDFNGKIASRPFWLSVANNSTYAPRIYYEDISEDGKKELIIILNKGYGTGVLLEEAFVIEVNSNQFADVLVDNPLAVVLKNVKTSLSTNEAKINIGDSHYTVDLRPVGIKPENVFKDIYFGSVIKYEIENKHLIARLAAQVSPAHAIGEVIITYEYRDKMYQAKSVEFQSY